MSVESRYLTARDVAELLQVDETTVYRWASRDSSMPVLRVGGIVRFNRERLTAWLEERTQRRGRTQGRTAAA